MVAPYKADTVNYVTNIETAKIAVGPYKAGTVNHAMMNETAKITDTIFIWHMRCIYRRKQIKKNYTFGQKDTM